MKFIDKLFKRNKKTELAYDGQFLYGIPINNFSSFEDFSFNTVNSDYLTRQFKNLVYSCVTLRAENVAKAIPYIYKRKNQTDKAEPNNHKFLKLLSRPNRNMTRYDMLYEYSKNLDLYGNCFFEITRFPNGEIDGLYLLPPQKERWKIIYDNNGNIKEYELSIKDKKVIYPEENIIHCKNSGLRPNSQFGMSIIEAGIDTFEMENAIATYQKKYFRNNAMKKFLVTPKNDFSQLEVERQKETMKNQSENGNDGDMLWVPYSVDVKILSTTPQEADYPQTWKIIQERTLSLFRINPSLIGIVGDVNRANAVAAYRDFINFSLDGIVKKLDNDMTKFLWNEYEDFNMFIEHKIQQPIDRDFELVKHESDCRYGKITINEARAFNGYDPLYLYDENGNPTDKLDPKGFELIGGNPDEVVPPAEEDPNNPGV